MAKRKRVDHVPRQRLAAPVPATKDYFADKFWLLALALMLVTFAAYAPVRQAGFIWDDDAHVTKNVNLHSWNGLWRIWSEPRTSQQYYPLELTSHWIEYHLWGLRPLGYHLVNVVLHALNAVLLWLVLRQLKIPGAWFAAAIFAVHPIEVESVAWVSERKNVLSGLFYLLAMLAYFRCRPLTETGTTDRRWYPLVLVLFVCALLSKTVACTLPAVLLSLTWWRRGRIAKRDIALLTPLFVLGAGLGLLTAWLEKHHVGAAGAEWSLTLVDRCLLAGRVLWFYAGKLCWPDPLIFIYPHWTINAEVWWQYLFPIAALVVLVVLWWKRERLGRGPLVATLAFAGTLFPALGFIDVYPFRFSFVADHFQYLAGASVIALVASTGAKLCARIGRAGPFVAAAGAPAILLVLGTLTWRQAEVYRDSETLWYDTLAKNPTCWMAHGNLGSELGELGQLQEGIGHFEEALRIKPDFAEVHSNWGNALLREGRIPEAIAHFEQALRIKLDDAATHNNLGIALLQVGKTPEAIPQFEEAVRIAPDYVEAHSNLGVALIRVSRTPEAIAHFEQALRIVPDDAALHNNLGAALLRVDRTSEAIAHFEQALRIKPDYPDAKVNLARARAAH